VAGSLLLPPAAAQPAVRVAFTIADALGVNQIPGLWDRLRSAWLVPAVPDAEGRAPFDSYTATGREKGLVPAGGAAVADSTIPSDPSRHSIAVNGAMRDSPPEHPWPPSIRHTVRESTTSGCDCSGDAASPEPAEHRPAASRRDRHADFGDRFASLWRQVAHGDVRADEATCAAVRTASGIDLARRLVAEQFGAPLAQLLDEYQAYRAGWQGRD